MEASAVDSLEGRLGEVLRSEIGKSHNDVPRQLKRDSFPTDTASEIARAPQVIPGGFDGLSADLERRARDGRNMVRVLDYERPLLESAAAEYDASYEALLRVVPKAQDTGRALRKMIDSTTRGEVTEQLGAQFTKNLKALDELEGVAETLTENLLRMRSTWEQYVRSVMRAQKMRDSLSEGGR